MQIFSVRLVAAARVAALPTNDFPVLVEFEMTALLQHRLEHLSSAANAGFHRGESQPKVSRDIGH